jgi:hypothetical protein
VTENGVWVRWTTWCRDNAMPLRVSAFFVTVNLFLSFTPIGHWFEVKAFSVLHRCTSNDAGKSVAIVDIKKIAGSDLHPTDPDHLQSVIEQVAASRPSAIGVDVDLSPSSDMVEGKGKRLLHFCQQLTAGEARNRYRLLLPPVPVFLGIKRSWRRPSSEWLSDPHYHALAAFIGIYPDDTRLAPRFLRSPKYAGGELRSISEALAESYLAAHHVDKMPGPNPLAFWLNRTTVQPTHLRRSVVAGETVEHTGDAGDESPSRFVNSVINFSLLSSKAAAIVEMDGGMPVLRETDEDGKVSKDRKGATPSFHGKMVLLGDLKERDAFPWWGAPPAKRGVLFHASAAYTFAVSPVFEFTVLARVVLDVALALFLIALTGSLLPVVRRLSPWMIKVNETTLETGDHGDRFHAIIMYGFLAVVLVLAIVFVWAFQILWLDFIAVLLALALHPQASKYAKKLARNQPVSDRPSKPTELTPDAARAVPAEESGGGDHFVEQSSGNETSTAEGERMPTLKGVWVFDILLCFVFLASLGYAMFSHAELEPDLPKAPPPAPEKDTAIVVSGNGTAIPPWKQEGIKVGPESKLVPGWELAPNGKMTIRYDNGRTLTITKSNPANVKSPGGGDRLPTYAVSYQSKLWPNPISLDLGTHRYSVHNLFTDSDPEDILFETGGIELSPRTSIFSPPDGGRVRPGSLILRWAPLPKGTVIELDVKRASVKADRGGSVWKAKITEDGSGVFVSPDLNARLAEFRTRDPNRDLTLYLKQAGEPDIRKSTFRPLSVQKDEELKKELAAWDANSLQLQHVYRASSFRRRGLFAESAEEMLQALDDSPNNSLLKRAACSALVRTGNLDRARAMNRELPPSMRLPGL